MSLLPAFRSRPRDAAKPIDDFDWPPTTDELSVYELEPDPKQIRKGAPSPVIAAHRRERPQPQQKRTVEPAPMATRKLAAGLAASAIVAVAAGCVLYATMPRPVAVQTIHHPAPPAATTPKPPKIKIVATYPVDPDPSTVAPAAPETAAPTVEPTVVDPGTNTTDAGIRSLLERYEEAYDRRDVRAAVELWPSADQGALTRAFTAPVRQNVHFDRCDIDASGARGSAVCVGTVRYVANIESGVEQDQRIAWTFDLARSGEDWRIAGLTAH